MATLNNRGEYPCTVLVTTLPLLPALKPKVFEHFVNYSQLPPRDARNILLDGFNPSIVVTDAPEVSGRYGYTPTTGEEIWLNRQVITEMETLLSGRSMVVSGVWNAEEDREFTKRFLSPRLRLLLEVTVMHELVHFGRQWVNGVNPDRAVEEAVVQAFEKKAYGRLHSATELGISEFVAEPL